ncbi:MAG TPA: glycosyltransferase family 39 protein [Acetobacteraceae bacterium]|nr:glycosyltransferase family 39 protein [Acetobacteraceae bacterium]
MVNARLKSCLAVLALAALVLSAAAALRGAEYDEQYTLFLTGGVARPAWPAAPFAAGEVSAMQAGHAGLGAIARDLRATDVHPPLYFWAVALWRRLIGGGLLAARLFSVLCGLAALAAVAAIARLTGVPPALAMLLTLGCYGFAYTGAIARGFALAQALTLWGVAVLLASEGRRGRALVGGMLLGAATFANYLAVFVLLTSPALPAGFTSPAGAGEVEARSDEGEGDRVGTRHDRIGTRLGGEPGYEGRACRPDHPRPRRWRVSTFPALAGEVSFLLADLWFFVAQRGSRTSQFPPFHFFDALQRLARYAAATLFGGLPLYVSPPAQPVATAAVATLALATVALVAVRWRHVARAPAARRSLAAAAAAPPIGLLVLGLVFHNTPIELRYLAFSTPFAALLLAGALASLPRLPRRAAIALLLTLQAAALAGLMTRPETMQPARATAAAVAHIAQGGLVLLPRGNDGVGIVGAFAIESPPTQRLLVIDPDETPGEILVRIGEARRVVLALLAQDDASRATLPAMRAAVSGPCWRRIADGFNVAAFDRICEGDAAWHSSADSR